MSPQGTEDESDFCDACGWPALSCVCIDPLDDDEDDMDDDDYEDDMDGDIW